MLTRTRDETLRFIKPFLLKGIDRLLPAGDYRVSTDEELIEGLSFPVYRRVATRIFVPGRANPAASMEMVSIDPADLRAARERDSAAPGASAADRPIAQDGVSSATDAAILRPGC